MPDDETLKAAKEAEDAAAELEARKAAAVTPVYRDVMRNPNECTGRDFVISGKIMQAMNSEVLNSKFSTYRIAEGGDYDKIWYITAIRSADEENLLEDDYVMCYFKCDATETYKAVLGNSITIPSGTSFAIHRS